MFAALKVDTAEKMSRRGNDRRRRECVLKCWKRGCPGRSRPEKRFGATDRAEWRAHVVGTDPECTAEWPGGARGREAGAGPAMGRSTRGFEAQTPVPPID